MKNILKNYCQTTYIGKSTINKKKKVILVIINNYRRH